MTYDLLTDREIRYYPADAADALQRARRAVEDQRRIIAALERERDELRESLRLALAVVEQEFAE